MAVTIYGVFTYDPTDREVADIVAYMNRMLDKFGPGVRFSVGYSETTSEEVVIAANSILEDADKWAEQLVFPEAEEQTAEYRNSEFHIDESHVSFPGWTNGRRWNGWAMPFFTKEVADQIVLTHSDELHPAKYDEATDTYLFVMDSGTGFADSENVDAFQGMDITVEGKSLHLYGIGSGSWVWCEGSMTGEE